MKSRLTDICFYSKEKVYASGLTLESYISTENMLSNKNGVSIASSLPKTVQTQGYKEKDVLVSNIRPYFKKIWLADKNGGCSNDVLVFRAKDGVDPKYLYYVLASDTFFEYSMATSKGTKMPRGDKKALMEYEVPNYKLEDQEKIARLLSCLDSKIQLNTKINKNLEQQAQTIFQERFQHQDNLPEGWKTMTLADVSIMSAGGDKPNTISSHKTSECQYPIYSNGISNDGLYGYSSDYKFDTESVTVSARGTIGFVCLRHIPYTPIVRLVTLIPHTNLVSAKYLYLWLKSIPIHGTGTTQQQLTVPDFRKTEIIVPSESEMRSFTDTVTPFYQQIWANQDESTKLADIRDSLLPKLMSGEIDVSDIDL